MFCLIVRPADVAVDFVFAEGFGFVGKRLRRLVALLHLQLGEVDRTAEHTRGRSCFEAAKRQAEIFQTLSQLRRGKDAVGSAFVADLADKNPAAEIGSRRDDDRLTMIDRKHLRREVVAVFRPFDVDDLRLTQLEVLLQFQLVLHRFRVLAPVDLRAE